VLQDVRFTMRSWRRTPGFAVAAIATLALGMGANTAIFSVVSGVLLRPLPFRDPDRLVRLTVSSPSEPRLPPTYVTIGDLNTWRESAASLEGASTYSTFSQNLKRDDGAEQVATVRVDGAFFRTLGVDAMIGRTFHDGDPANVVVMSFGFWQRHFGSDRTAIGRQIVLDGQPFTLAGVMPETFQFPLGATRTDLWTPWTPPVSPNARLDAIVGRLKPGVAVDRARAELSGLSGRLMPGRSANVTPLPEVVGGPVRLQLLVLLGAVGLVLLVACANVANLLLARAAARAREVAVRMALGAGRRRLVGQFLTESLLLSFAGGFLGALIGDWGRGMLVSLAGSQIPRAWDIGFDWRVFAFVLGVCVATGVGFGLAPAFGAARASVQRGLASGGRGSSARSYLRDGLVVAEVAMAFVLLVGAGLLLRTFINLRGTPTGFNPENVVTLHIVVADANESSAIEQRVARIPGVRAVGFISLLPLQHSDWYGRITIEGRPGEGSAEFRYVSPGYFEAMGIPIRRGRAFSGQDVRDAPKAIVVNEAFVRKYLPNEDPIGRILRDRGAIVGVAGDVLQVRLDRPAVPEIFYPIAQNFAQLRAVGSALVVRGHVPPESLVPAIRDAIREVNPNQATFRVQTMEHVIAESMGSQTLYLWLLGVFAGIGTLLASAGVYGVMAYVVTLRTRELGVRMALGADRSRVLRLVLGRGAVLVGSGLAIGFAGAAGLTRFLESVLYGVTAIDPVTFSTIAVLLGVVALAACLIPAQRAARIDPAVTLRGE
jgi:predicted permease